MATSRAAKAAAGIASSSAVDDDHREGPGRTRGTNDTSKADESAKEKNVVQVSTTGPLPLKKQTPAGDGSKRIRKGRTFAETGDPAHISGVSLADVVGIARCLYGPAKATREDAWLTGVLQVYQDPQGKGRLAYKASFFLDTNATADDDDATKQDSVAFIDSWRIEKRTAAAPNASEGWVEHFLEPKIGELVDTDEPVWSETALCLQALYMGDGTVKDSVQHLEEELEHKSLMFIDLVYTAEQHQNKGLLRPMMRLYRRLLRRLPEWFAFAGVLVLIPGAPGKSWGNMPLDEVEEQLISIYSRCDGYAVLRPDAVAGITKYTVMGRKVK